MSLCIESKSVANSGSAIDPAVQTLLPANTVLLETKTTSSSEDVGHQCETVIESVVESPISVYNDIVPANNVVSGNAVRTITKLPMSTNDVNLSKTSLITVLNTPLGNVKTLCVTPAQSANAVPGQFTVVNSSPLGGTSAGLKSQTITLINTPVTVVKTISSQGVNTQNITGEYSIQPSASVIDNRGHTAFVKNTCNSSSIAEEAIGPQSHKLLTVTNLSGSNILDHQSINSSKSGNKLKIVGNVIVSNAVQPVLPSNVTYSPSLQSNKNNTRFISQQHARPKVIGGINSNGTAKNVGKQLIKRNPIHVSDNTVQIGHPPQRVMFPANKSQIRTLSPVNNLHNPQQNIKTLTQRLHSNEQLVQPRSLNSGIGVKMLPAQRIPPKLPNRLNYIGKHAIQGQKLKAPPKIRTSKANNNVYNYNTALQQQDTQVTFNQALTAEILETLSSNNKSSIYNSSNQYLTPTNSISVIKKYDTHPKYNDEISMYQEPDNRMRNVFDAMNSDSCGQNKTALDALSLICQAVLLDHNYNATLPIESPSRQMAPIQSQSQINSNTPYSPTATLKQRCRGLMQSSSVPSMIPQVPVHLDEHDDAASDVSDNSCRKHDTEGEETDTAPEAEAVANEDQFGDYVTRCLCGFLHDDGYMVECDKCKVWQHVQCVVKDKQIPDEYLCEICDPLKPIDRQRAKSLQEQWLKNRQVLEPKLGTKREFKPKERLPYKYRKEQNVPLNSDTDSSDAETPSTTGNLLIKPRSILNKRKMDTQKVNKQKRDGEAKDQQQNRRHIKKRKVIKRKIKAPVRVLTQTTKEEECLDAVSTSAHLPQLRQWIENYEEAVTNHYSPELRARISSIRVNGQNSDISAAYDSTVHKCRVHTQPLTEIKYLVTTVHLPSNNPIIELRGKYMLSTQHRNCGGTLTTRQHTQRPGPFLFFYRLHKDNTEVCVDTRTYGNSARFIRRSCKPNAELRHCIEKGVLHLYVVTIDTVEKNCEITIKHESHDLAAIGTTYISCACGNPAMCTVNKSPIKKNGDIETQRKRRGRRSLSQTTKSNTQHIKKSESARTKSSSNCNENKTEILNIKKEHKDEKFDHINDDVNTIQMSQVINSPVKEEVDIKSSINELNETFEQTHHTPQSSPNKTECKYNRDTPEVKVVKTVNNNNKNDKSRKLSREERKLEAILRAIAQMEKADQRKQENQAKQQIRRDSDPSPCDKEEKYELKLQNKKRRGRTRTTSSGYEVRSRINSSDSYLTSSNESGLLSPNDEGRSSHLLRKIQHNNKDAGLLLALSNGSHTLERSPAREIDSNSSSIQSSPETPPNISSACLLVQAAVEPMEASFKFPKTKKVLMNEWLNKTPETISNMSLSGSPTRNNNSGGGSDNESCGPYFTTGKSLAALAQVATFCDGTNSQQSHGSAKKRWLRQAMGEGDPNESNSPVGSMESPPPMGSGTAEIAGVAPPPKKRRLPRESIEETPPNTPSYISTSNFTLPESDGSGGDGAGTGTVEFYVQNNENDTNEDTIIIEPNDEPTSSSITVINDVEDNHVEVSNVSSEIMNDLSQSVSSTCSSPLPQTTTRAQSENPVTNSIDLQSLNLLDPRINRSEHGTHHLFSNSEHLVGTVEKTLSILGFDDKKEPTPKKKLSISEYRQRKKITNDDSKNNEDEQLQLDDEQTHLDESNSSDSFKPNRNRCESISTSTSLSSSDDDDSQTEVAATPSAFNCEPTELEREREMANIRLKKVFGITINDDVKKTAPLGVEAIMNCDIPASIKSIQRKSPTFPLPRSFGVCIKNTPSLVNNSDAEDTGNVVEQIGLIIADNTDNGTTDESLEKNSTKSQSPLQTDDNTQPMNCNNNLTEINLDSDDTKVLSEFNKNNEDQCNSSTNVEVEEKNVHKNDAYKKDSISKHLPEVEKKVEREEEEICSTNNAFEIESIDYVPPFNNPIYPNDDGFLPYSSSIDDDERYEGRNPSPPIDLNLESGIFAEEQS